MNDQVLSAASRQGLRLWRALEVIGMLGAIAFSVLIASGWRVQKPSEVTAQNETKLAVIDARVTTLEKNYASIDDTMKDMLRLQCLSTSRRDANLAGTCTGLPTRDDSPRTPR